jgi:hypothetical protein
MAAMRAVPSTSPLLARPAAMVRSVAGRMRMRPAARAMRCVTAFAPTPTMCAAPLASKWLNFMYMNSCLADLS